MQPIPFSGLLTIIHLSVVVFGKIFYYFFPARLHKAVRPHSHLLIIFSSLLVILLILGFSVISAVYAVRASLEDKNSTVNYAEFSYLYIQNVMQYKIDYPAYLRLSIAK